MKRIFSISLMLFIVSGIRAQSSTEAIRENFQFAKKVEISESAGKNFRYEMAVHSDKAESLEGVHFFWSGYRLKRQNDQQQIPEY